MINSHVHSKYSVDSTEELYNILETAIEKGLNGIAITDHVSIYYNKRNLEPTDLLACKKEVFSLREKYKDKIKLLFGMEYSETHLSDEFNKKALGVGDFDVILCSLHDEVLISNKQINSHFRKNDFKSFNKEELIEIVKTYYLLLKDAVKNFDYDVLAHLTYPFRYITFRDKVDFDFNIIKDDIEEILKILIKRNKALELNTSNATDGFFMPNEQILKTYKALGGELITLGSDAHIASNVDKGLNLGKILLKKCGFTKYYYYENRKPKIAELL